jgi:hypothetical protein
LNLCVSSCDILSPTSLRVSIDPHLQLLTDSAYSEQKKTKNCHNASNLNSLPRRAPSFPVYLLHFASSTVASLPIDQKQIPECGQEMAKYGRAGTNCARMV